MASILFYDPACRTPYDTRTLERAALGGTESTVVRVADALGAQVVQHNRTEAWDRYRPPAGDPSITHVVIAREAAALPVVHALYPNAKLFLWLHDRMREGGKRARRLARSAPLLRELAPSVICVSDWQRQGVEATLRAIGAAPPVQAVTIYNPIDERLTPQGLPVDPGRLVFFSSPNKGLAYTLDAFRFLKRRLPDLTLVVGNPGYKERAAAHIPGVTYLGAQPQARIHAEVRTALATFSPNFVIPETFGLVFAESLALGTPVLTHDVGAAGEVIADPRQVLPVTPAQRLYETLVGGLKPSWRAAPARAAAQAGLFNAYLERIEAWRAGGRPVTAPDPRFHLTQVIERWRALLQT